MKIVIEIPEKMYKHILSMQFFIPGLRSGKSLLNEILKAIRMGTPLPKGHGRIIDESKIEVCEWVNELEEDYPKASTDAPTIIEADGGGKE